MLEESTNNKTTGVDASATSATTTTCAEQSCTESSSSCSSSCCLAQMEAVFLAQREQQHQAGEWLKSSIEHLCKHHHHAHAEESASAVAVQLLLSRMALAWCRLAGRQEQYESVVEAADIVLKQHQSAAASTSSRRPQQQQRAMAMAYKGFALMKINKAAAAAAATSRNFSEALDCLEQAQNLFHQIRPRNQQQQQVQQNVQESIIECCQELGGEPPLPPMMKFPRTAHLFRPPPLHDNSTNTAMSSDDIVLDKDHAMLRRMCDGETVVIMEEKMDGANLGISLSLDGRRILVQNRSHYISGGRGEHAQFSQLHPFIEQHRTELLRILTVPDDNDDDTENNKDKVVYSSPDAKNNHPKSRQEEPAAAVRSSRRRRRRHILFGEWLVARHSIPYGQLPGSYFVAFDLYDIFADKFVSRRKLHTLLAGTGIPVAPILERRTFGPYQNNSNSNSKNNTMEGELLQILTTTKSRFRTDGGLIEGIVFRIENEDWLQERSKLVRPDFVAGCQDGHWSKRAIDKQIVDFEFGQEYLQQCYTQAVVVSQAKVTTQQHSMTAGLALSVENPHQQVLVTFDSKQDNSKNNGKEFVATLTTVIGNPKKVDSDDSTNRQVLMLPRNMSWLWQNEVAIASTPTCPEHVAAFQDTTLNIGFVVTLTEEQPLPSEWFTAPPPPPTTTSTTLPLNAKKKNGRTANVKNTTSYCRNIFHAISIGSPPTLQQMDCIGDDIVRAVAQGRAVLEHCDDGKGRAGSIAAALLLRFGPEGIRHRLESENSSNSQSLYRKPPFMTSDEAIQWIRQRRPGSVPTIRQEEFVHEYARHLWRLAAAEQAILQVEEDDVPVTSVAENPNHSTKPTAKQCGLPSYIVLAGIPGSGKSTIASCLAQSQSCRNSSFVHASQDELGSKACQDLVGRESARVANGQIGGIIVDCCSVRESERRHWLKIMHQPPANKTALILVDTPVDVCIARVRARVGHPTIPFARGERIVRGFSKNLEFPQVSESGLFGQIEVVRSPQQVADLLQRWGIQYR